MADKLVYIPNDDIQNYYFCRLQLVLDTQPNKPTSQISITVPKCASQRIRKLYHKTLGTIAINSPKPLFCLLENPCVPSYKKAMDFIIGLIRKKHLLFKKN